LVVELKKEEYSIAKNLFSGLHFQINCLAVLNNDAKGRIWVNNKEDPQSGLLVDSIYVMYSAGNPYSVNFNKDIVKIINNEIFPASQADSDTPNEWYMSYDDPAWQYILEVEFEKNNPTPIELYHFIFSENKIKNWREEIPDQYSLHQVDSYFLKQDNLKNHNHIANWINRSWKSLDDFLNRGFCFYITFNDSEIVSWAISDWATEDKIEMGITTMEGYRQKGLATLVTAAAADYCTKEKNELRWFCATHNIPSWKTAEKVGFIKFKEYFILCGDFK